MTKNMCIFQKYFLKYREREQEREITPNYVNIATK